MKNVVNRCFGGFRIAKDVEKIYLDGKESITYVVDGKLHHA